MSKSREKSALTKFDAKSVSTATIVYKSRVFQDVSLNLPKCRAAMIAILQALSLDAQFSDRESTELFFSMTQLFHSKDTYIRRLLHLLLKKIPVSAHDSIIVTHSLSKDITGEPNLSQGQAIRCLCAILDATNALSLERFLKVSIISSFPYTACAALSGALRILEGGRKEAVMRWLPEIRQASKSDSRAVRYHALLLLYALNADDVHGSARLASTLDEARSTLEQCVALSIAFQSIKGKANEHAIAFIRSCLKESPIVRLEAARHAPPSLDEEVVRSLESLLGASILKSFAAVRTIANTKDCKKFTPLLPKIYPLIKHTNSSLAAMAVICVLKLGDATQVDVATKRIIYGCKSWSPQLIKTVAEESCRYAGDNASDKQTEVAIYLMKVARDQSTKLSILRSILTTNGIPKSSLLPMLAEYLEDWDSITIAKTICDFIAYEASKIDDPLALIPSLFNRVSLDIGPVRMAAINAMAAIGSVSSDLAEKVLPLIKLHETDEDDQIRELAVLISHAFEVKFDLKTISSKFVMQDEEKPDELEEELDEVVAGPIVPAAMNPMFEKFGDLIYKTDAIPLTDRDSEFVVSFFLNVYKEHFLFEFLCTNTVQDLDVTGVYVDIDGLEVEEVIEAPEIHYQQTAYMYSVVKRNTSMLFGVYDARLVYNQEDSEDETWPLNSIKLGASVWLTENEVEDFYVDWESSGNETATVLAIGREKSIAKATKLVEEEIHLAKISEEKDKKKTTLTFSGKAIDSTPVLIMTQLGIAKTKGVVCRIAIRGPSKQLNESILQSLTF